MSGIGVAEWCLPDRDRPTMRQLKALGLDAIHVNFSDPGRDAFIGSGEACRRKFQEADEAGLAVTALAMNALESIGIGESPAHESFDLAMRGIDTAARWSVPLVYVPNFNRARIGDMVSFGSAVAFLRVACERAEGSNVLVATENVLGSADALRLLNEVSHPKIRIMVDLYNPVLYGFAVTDILTAVFPYLATQIHVKDGRGGVMGNAPVGGGEARFDDSAAFLIARKFHCLAVLENDYAVEPEARIRRDMAAVERRMGPILSPSFMAGM